MGRALLRLGQPDEAIVSVSRPAEMFKADSELEAYSQSLGLLGECLRGAGRHAEALELYTEMYELTSDENSGMTPSVAALTRPHARGAIALCLSELGRHAEAIPAYIEALTLFGQFPVAPSKGRCMVRLAESLAAAGRIGESRQTCLRAAEVFEAVGDPEAAARLRGLASG
ncbi:tetratricopeptide repeat protein [Nonomuraea sp. AD125B]|uniref:tetratricopeptide repeat protein n=1 Tax=Nonomuraea sp. AD125B TaxID=3242897 RepID=UPI003528487B